MKIKTVNLSPVLQKKRSETLVYFFILSVCLSVTYGATLSSFSVLEVCMTKCNIKNHLTSKAIVVLLIQICFIN